MPLYQDLRLRAEFARFLALDICAMALMLVLRRAATPADNIQPAVFDKALQAVAAKSFREQPFFFGSPAFGTRTSVLAMLWIVRM